MVGLSKEYLTKIDGIGDSYAEDILGAYSTYRGITNDSAEEIHEKAGIPENVAELLLEKIGSLRIVHEFEAGETNPPIAVKRIEERKLKERD